MWFFQIAQMYGALLFTGPALPTESEASSAPLIAPQVAGSAAEEYDAEEYDAQEYDAQEPTPDPADSVDVPSPLAGGVLSFHVGQAIALGTGCPNKGTDVEIQAIPDGFSVRFKTASIFMTVGNPQLATLKNCSVRIPVDIAAGHRISGLTQRLRYVVAKSSGSSGTGVSHLTFLGDLTSPLMASDSFGSSLWMKQVALDRDDAVGPIVCGGGMLLALNVAFLANRKSSSEYILMVPNKLRVREGIEIRTKPC